MVIRSQVNIVLKLSQIAHGYTSHRTSCIQMLNGQKPKGHAGPKALKRAHVHSNICICMGVQL